MKRFLSLLLMLSLLAVPALAETTADPLAEQAIALGARLGELAASEVYVAAYSASDTIAEAVAAWAEGDYGMPAAIQRVTLDPASANILITALMGVDSSAGLSGAAYDELARRLLTALPTMINSTLGAETLAATSIMTIQTAILCEACEMPTLYILSYERGAPVTVAFQPCQDGAVLAQAGFLGLPSGEAAETVLSGAIAALGALGMTELEEIPLP